MKKIFIFLVAAVSTMLAFSSADKFDRQWEIHLIPHTHVDIGYTESQEEVMRKQWHNLEEAMDIIEKTANLPPEARFKWSPEVTWAIETWLKQADATQKDRFIRHVRNGSIGLDAMFGNMLTGLCRPEELMRAVAFKEEIEEITGIKIDSAMITDVPGWSWGTVTALSTNGVKYLSLGPNRSHRIGYTLSDWADKPFYWVSPSGKDKVLCFVHGKGYSWFHTPLALIMDLKANNKFKPRKIFRYLKELSAQGYPYEIVPIRYAIGSDNGPPDPGISEIVARWNCDHPQVRVKITTVSQSLREFESRYGKQLPEYSGDFTPYWEDGAASTARETALARNASEKLDQAQTLWMLMDPGGFPAYDFERVWKEVLLFDEHTWGAFNSVYMPDSDFARSQWEWKKQRALNADQMAGELLARILDKERIEQTGDAKSYIDVINTHSWDVTGPVVVKATGRVETTSGETIPSQVMENGWSFFIAENVPGMSGKRYILKDGKGDSPGKCVATDGSLSNGKYKVKFDRETGVISSIVDNKNGTEFVNADFGDKFNEYIYIRGRKPKTGRLKRESSEAIFTIGEKGPLVCSVHILRKPPKSDSLKTTVTMYDGLDRIDIVNELDRPVIRDKEGIHFAFPVLASNPVVRYDIAWGSVEVDKDQLAGSCRNYYTPLRWVDVSGDSSGIEFVLRDAPLFESGAIATDARKYGWLRKTEHNGVVYSYVMNNYWETNYKADQPEVTTFRYSLFPHGEYNVASNNKRSMEVMQPLLVSTGGTGTMNIKPPVEVDADEIVILSIKPAAIDQGMQVDLFNVSDGDVTARIRPVNNCQELYLVKDGNVAERLPDRARKFVGHELIQLICKP